MGVRPALRLPDQNQSGPADLRVCSVVAGAQGASVRTSVPVGLSCFAPCEGLDHCPCRVRRGIPVALRPGSRFHGPKPVVWSRGSPRPATSLPGATTLRPALRMPDQNPSFGLADGRAPDLRLIWWVQTLDKRCDGSQTSGIATCIAVQPRLERPAASRAADKRPAPNVGVPARRMRCRSPGTFRGWSSCRGSATTRSIGTRSPPIRDQTTGFGPASAAQVEAS